MGRKGSSTSRKSTPTGTPTKASVNSKKGSPKTSKDGHERHSIRDRAVYALQQLEKFEKRKHDDSDDANTLIGGDEELGKYVQLIAINNTSFTGAKKEFKLKLFEVKHSLFEAWKMASATMVKDFKILLILKDSDAGVIEAHQILEDAPGMLEIIAAKELKTSYKAYEQRRALLADFSLILADDSVITALPKLLGNKAYEKVETTPISIKTHSNGHLSLQTIKSNFAKIYQRKLPVALPRGTTMNVHLGHLDWFSLEELADNVESIIEQLKGKYSIRSIFVKCTDSPAIPLYYNQKALNEISKAQGELETAKDGTEPHRQMEIDGVKVDLSQFDSALAEIANPGDLRSLFDHKLKRSPPDQEQKSGSMPKSKKVKV